MEKKRGGGVQGDCMEKQDRGAWVIGGGEQGLQLENSHGGGGRKGLVPYVEAY